MLAKAQLAESKDISNRNKNKYIRHSTFLYLFERLEQISKYIKM